MRDSEFQKHFEEALAFKKNSFSRNLLLSYKDELSENTEWYVPGADLSRELAWYLYNYDLLNIHAIDEKEAPVSFSALEKIYGDRVFILQELAKKKSLMLLIQDVVSSDKQKAIVNVFKDTWNFTAKSLGDIHLKNNRESYLDFGFLKSAMTLRKTYGIQDLLEVGFSAFKAYEEKRMSDIFIVPKMTQARLILNIEHPELSTITLSAPNTMLTLQGKTKIIEEKHFVDKISFALKIFKACRAASSI